MSGFFRAAARVVAASEADRRLSMHNDVAIRLVRTEAEKEAIYRFRYDIYVKEMQRPQQYADHTCAMIREPLDETAHLFGAFLGKRIVGTLRLNFARETELGYYQELYEMNWAGEFHPAHTSISTKFMVAREYRGSQLGLKIAVAAYRFLRSHKIEFNFIDCNSHLLSLFRLLGYRQHRPNICHPEYGEVTPLVLALSDEAHLKAIRSPFRKYVSEVPAPTKVRDFLTAKLEVGVNA